MTVHREQSMKRDDQQDAILHLVGLLSSYYVSSFYYITPRDMHLAPRNHAP